MRRIWLAGVALLALSACDRGAGAPPATNSVAIGKVAADATDPGALPPPLPPPPVAAPLPAAPPARYAEPWRAARAQADRIAAQQDRYRRDAFAYDRGYADAWREGEDVVRTTDARGRTFYYRPGDPDPYWATADGRSYAYENGRPAYAYESDGRAAAIGGEFVGAALEALAEGRDLHRRAHAPQRDRAPGRTPDHEARADYGPPPGPPPQAAYDDAREAQVREDRARYDAYRDAQARHEAEAARLQALAAQAGADRAEAGRYDAQRRLELERARQAQQQQVDLYRRRGPVPAGGPPAPAPQPHGPGDRRGPPPVFAGSPQPDPALAQAEARRAADEEAQRRAGQAAADQAQALRESARQADIQQQRQAAAQAHDAALARRAADDEARRRAYQQSVEAAQAQAAGREAARQADVQQQRQAAAQAHDAALARRAADDDGRRRAYQQSVEAAQAQVAARDAARQQGVEQDRARQAQAHAEALARRQAAEAARPAPAPRSRSRPRDRPASAAGAARPPASGVAPVGGAQARAREAGGTARPSRPPTDGRAPAQPAVGVATSPSPPLARGRAARYLPVMAAPTSDLMTSDDVLAVFREAGALREGHFVLSSGLHSGVFLQKNLVFMSAARTERLCRALAQRITERVGAVDAVVSPAIGAIIPGYETARWLKVPSLYVEREGGAFKLRRGFELAPGARVAVVEDIVTTGLSSRECIEAIRAAGGDVVCEGCIVDRSGGRADVGAPLVALGTLDVPAYPADALPPELAAIPVTDPGSRRLKA